MRIEVNLEQVDGVTVAHLQGDALDASNAKEFKTQVAMLITPQAKLIFELSRLKFIDSSGLGALLSCLRQVNACGGSLKLCSMVKPVRALFQLVRMHRVFEIYNTQDEALLSHGQTAQDAA